jgi:intraflagellar transport protein 56
MLSRAKPAIEPAIPPQEQKKKMPTLESFIANRDYIGAITLLEFNKKEIGLEGMLWLGFSYFHLGDYRKSMDCYLELLKDPKIDSVVHLYLGICYFFLGMYKESDESAQRGPSCKLQNRLLFHLSHKFNDEKRLMGYHQNLQDVIEDQVLIAYIVIACLNPLPSFPLSRSN